MMKVASQKIDRVVNFLLSLIEVPGGNLKLKCTVLSPQFPLGTWWLWLVRFNADKTIWLLRIIIRVTLTEFREC